MKLIIRPYRGNVSVMKQARSFLADTEILDRRDDHGGIQVIARAATILRALENSPGGLGLGAISRLVGLPRSTVQRIVAALEAEGFVESGGPDGVRLGPGLFRLAATIQPALADMIRPLIEGLSRTPR